MAAGTSESRKIAADCLQRIHDYAEPAPPKSDTPWQLIEPLTEREEEILVLLAKPYTNREIADQLFIPPATVTRHTINIYQKLSVHKRREAVEVAKALDIIPLP